MTGSLEDDRIRWKMTGSLEDDRIRWKMAGTAGEPQCRWKVAVTTENRRSAKNGRMAERRQNPLGGGQRLLEGSRRGLWKISGAAKRQQDPLEYDRGCRKIAGSAGKSAGGDVSRQVPIEGGSGR
jgi:hypothetical protein